MALRGKKPEPMEKRLKALFFGEAGAGKTTAAIQFPRPYVVDTEKGAVNDQYGALIIERGGALLLENDFNEIVREVTALLSEKHEYRTLIIDPITTVYNDLIEKCEMEMAAKSKTGDGTEFGRHYSEAKKRWGRLANLLNRLDMNVIITSHQKNLYGDKMAVLGKTFDGPKGLDYMFDLVFEVAKRGNERVGIVRKTRVQAFVDGDLFPFTYDNVAERYGRAILERDAAPVVLATKEDADALLALLAERKDGDDLLAKWLSKAEASTLSEMPAEAVTKCIAFLSGNKAAA